jgi:hypothetical protein
MNQSDLRTALKAILDKGSFLGTYNKDSKEPNEPAIRVGEPNPSWHCSSGLECVIDEYPQLVPVRATYDGADIQEVYRIYLVRHNSGDLLAAAKRILQYFQTATAQTVNSRQRVIDVPYYIIEIRNPD